MAEASDLLSVQININGKASNAEIMEIEVFKTINKIARAKVKLIDGSKAKEDFKLSDSSDFVPGNEIEIKAGYHSKEKTIFKGILISQTISIDAEEGPSLVIECFDKAFETTKVQNNAYFIDRSDSDIINKILGNYSFSKSVDSTSYKYEKVIQYGATDWDFVVSRAEINGLVVITSDGKTTVTKPDISSSPVLSLTYGDNILELDISVSSNDQLADVTAIAWDTENQALVEGNSVEPSVNSQGDLTGKKLSSVLSAKAVLQSPVPLEGDVLTSWANAQLLKSRLSRFHGTILCEGSAIILPNTLIEIKGVGKKINGKAYVSGVHHELKEGRWFTEISIGLRKNWFTQDVPVNALTAAGRLPAINGLQIGVVKKIHEDPAQAFRVLVTLPLIKTSDDGLWARLSTFYASNTFGNFFYPEIGDEVILGFLDDNPSAPIILGSVYSKKNAPALVPDEKNTHKAITTRSKMTMDFDDELKIIKIETPAKNSIIISEEDKAITITDQHKNEIKLNEDGITIHSIKDIIIEATNDIKMSGVNIDIKASADLTRSGANTKTKAQMAYSAEGGATAELKAGGNTTIKGAMVAIN
ncbi:type VI secretion system tip protein VgrG [Lacinutrix chionoecetis]